MRPLWKDLLAAVWLGILIPGILLNGLVLRDRLRNVQQPPPSVRAVPTADRTVLVRDPDGVLEETELENYLTGVLLAEMPADFHEEALKAQAVAARTYTWKASTAGGKHGDRSVCTDSACCQAHLSEEAYLSRGGTREALDKVRGAVEATSGFVLYHGGALVEATYFSSTGGSTESAVTVWGTDYPYLQAVSSPEEVEAREVVYTAREFQRLLGTELTGPADSWFGPVSYTEGGGVAALEIGGIVYSGTRLRSLLGLRSTDFRIRAQGQRVTITTRGHGHRVGMSQYGANAMAESGSTWQQILQHYYPGTTLAPLD